MAHPFRTFSPLLLCAADPLLASVLGRTLALALAAALTGCATLSGLAGGEGDGDGKNAKRSATEKAPEVEARPSGLTEEQELKIARLWARVDEMEEEQFRQKERLRVIEKGMTLGLVPEELKAEKPKAGAARSRTRGTSALNPPDDAEIVEPLLGAASPAHAAEKPKASAAPISPSSQGHGGEPAMSPAEQERYQAMLASAQEQYRSGRYGRAIVEYDALGKQFGDKIEGGMHKFWIAKSWSNLKENNTSRQLFTDFLAEHAASPWASRAKLELGRVEWQLGLQETALMRFRDLINAHPHEDAAEMARMELEQLDKTL